MVIFQGELPVKEYLRVHVPLPKGKIQGKVVISATLVIAPEVDPGFPNLYTRHGIELTYRPHAGRFSKRGGKVGTVPISKPFFTSKALFPKGEYQLRREDYKWEPCLKAQKVHANAQGLSSASFDIYHHSRDKGHGHPDPRPIPYALVLGVLAPKDSELYNRVVRSYQNILVPMQPQLRIRVSR